MSLFMDLMNVCLLCLRQDFFNWNKVKIRYCDGASLAGNPENELHNGTNLFFRGQLIWEAVMDELLSIGMSSARQALLSGCLAGGLAAVIHCDDFREIMPKNKVLKLTKNMRLQQGSSANNSHEIQKFVEWILEVGDGTIGGPNDGEVTIQFPQEVLITDIGNNPIASIVEATYPALFEHLDQPEYFQERAILSPTHDIVDEVNDYLLSLIPWEERVYYSADSICKADGNDAMMYSSDMLHSIKCSGVPNHVLKLKIGVPVMLRNIDQSNGICNGTRLMITKLGTRMIEGRIISGRNIGQIVPIPRMLLSSSDSTLSFKFQCRQFPIIVLFAMTINKSQGQSLSQVGLYLPRAVFTHDQLYVCLSRVTILDDLNVLILDKNGKTISETTNVVYKEVLQNI